MKIQRNFSIKLIPLIPFLKIKQQVIKINKREEISYTSLIKSLECRIRFRLLAKHKNQKRSLEEKNSIFSLILLFCSECYQTRQSIIKIKCTWFLIIIFKSDIKQTKCVKPFELIIFIRDSLKHELHIREIRKKNSAMTHCCYGKNNKQ